MRSRSRWLPLALIGLAAYAWLAHQVYRSASSPETFRVRGGAYAWLVGPSARNLEEAAGAHITRGLELLQDRSLASAVRVRSYRAELERAEALLVRSLRSQPAQARALAQLTAVRWELEPPLTESATRRTTESIALASSMAPTAPQVQLQLGELLLKMGRLDEALLYLKRTVQLAPGMSKKVVRLLRENLLAAEEILRVLPGEPEVLVALQSAFIEDERETAYLDAVESILTTAGRLTPYLFMTYGNVALRIGQAGRLRDRMDDLGPLAEPGLEAERLRQRSRAHLALHDAASALTDARQARELVSSPQFIEHLGNVLLFTGSGSEAIGAFRQALGLVARGGGNSATRVRLYGKIGQAEEQQGSMARAYDAYKLALRLDPEDRYSRRRIEEMERAAGLIPGREDPDAGNHRDAGR